MKKFVTIFLVFIFQFANATDYYVSSSGSNTNNGTSTSTPWQTISKVDSTTLAAGDHVWFNRGDVFYGYILVHNSGASGNPIAFGAYGTGANPVITGFTTVSTWTNLGSNIWESSSAVSALNDCNLVTINGVNTAMGRYPNTGWLKVDSHTNQTSLTSTGLAGGLNWAGADVVAKVFNFSIVRDQITAQSGNTLTTVPTDVESFSNNYGFFIENDSRTLDAQNEWYFNPSTKKLRIYSTTTPSNVKLATQDSLVYCINKSYITFDGIDFTGSNRRTFFIGSSSNITIQNCNVDYCGLYAIWGGNNFGTASNNNNFNHNTFNHINSQGIVLANEFSNTYIGYNSIKNSGVFYGMFKVPVLNNGPNSVWNGAFGAMFINLSKGTAATIEYNTIDTSGYSGIWFVGSHMRINNNDVAHASYRLQDNAGIYSMGVRGTTIFTDIKIYNNMCHDAFGDSSGVPVVSGNRLASGIYLDENTINTQCYNNSCFRNPLYGIFSNSNTACSITGNTCYDNNQGGAYFASTFRATRLLADGSTGPEMEIHDTSKNNIFFARTGTTFNTQLSVRFGSKYCCLDSFFNVLDSNYYSRPIDESQHVFLSLKNSGGGDVFSHFSVAQWKTYANTNLTTTVGKDAHSDDGPVGISDVNQLDFEYNATSSNKTISLSGNYMDVRGVKYNGTITLAPYTSAVLIKDTSCLLPSGWATTDIGTTTPSGSACEDGGTFTVNGSGADIYGNGDAFRFAYKRVEGDNVIIAKINSFSGTGTFPKSGVMVRETLENGSKNALLSIMPSGNSTLQYRQTTDSASSTATGSSTVSLPYWVKITRIGNTIKGYISSNGTAWTLKNTLTISMTDSVYMGLAVCNNGNGNLASAVFTNVSIYDTCSLPSGWTTQDIGTTTPSGSGCENGGTFTLQGSGADVYGNGDAFRFACKKVSGDNVIIAKINSFSGTGTFPKSGVMVRETLDNGSKNAFVTIMPSGNSTLQYRQTTDSASSTATGSSTVSLPYWVKITRIGNTIKGYISPDGSAWTLKNTLTISMTDSVYIGLAVCNNSNGNLATAVFTNVSIYDTCGLPSGWGTQDIGSTIPAGSACEDAGTFTLQGSGTDIYGNGDAFRFAYKKVSGDNTITARINSFSGTGTFPKSGVMVRETLNNGSKNALVSIMPSGNSTLQYRQTTNSTTSTATGSSTVSLPYWVKITRVGSTIKGYISSNGTTWTLKNTVTISMADSVYMGLAVCNNGNGNLASGVFTNVSVQSGEVLMMNSGAPVISADPSLKDDYIYPNPASGIFYISINSLRAEKAIVSITDLKGQVVVSQFRNLIKGNNKIDISIKDLGLAAGVYLVRVSSGTKKFVSRLVIEK